MGKIIYSKNPLQEQIQQELKNLETARQPTETHSELRSVIHRGFSYIAPENTLSAFRLAAEYKPWGIEADFWTSSDGHWVCIHDGTVDRTTNASGDVSSFTLAQLRELDAGSWFSPRYAGEQIPTLEEYLTIAYRSGMVPYLDVKGTRTTEELQKIVDVVKKFNAEDKTVMNSLPKTNHERMRSLSSKIKLSWYGSTLSQADVLWAKELGNTQLSVTVGNVTPEKMAYAHENNVDVEFWTVNNMIGMELAFSLGAKSVITDTLPSVRGYGSWS